MRRRKTMTLEEWNQFRSTLEYAEEKCMRENYDLLTCKDELEALGANEATIAEEGYAMMIEATGNIEEAELELIKVGYLPPTYRTDMFCNNCGPVLVKDAALPCPWCGTLISKLVQQIYEEKLYGTH